MPKPIPEDLREQIVAALGTGASRNQIAQQFGVSHGTVSNIAKAVGHTFGQSNLTHAQAARNAYTAERRAALILKAVESSERLFGQMFAPTLVYNFGGKDNTYNERQIDQPSFKDKQAIANSIAALMRTVADIERREVGNTGAGQLDDIREAIRRDAARYRAERSSGVGDRGDDPPDQHP